jgi:hypothetical protein
MIAVPGEIPVTTPVVTPTVAIALVLELHVPPVTAFVNVEVEPLHIFVEPAIDEGRGNTVTIAILLQPVLSE